MNWKPNLSRGCALTLGLTLMGCGSAQPDSANQAAAPTATQLSTDSAPAAANLVTLDLPGMT